jgi:hypothetical protein
MSTPPDNTIPTAPQVELLARPPLVMRRPLCLLEGRAYAAAWLDVRVTHPPQQDAQGKPRSNALPRVVEEKRVFIMRDDGMLFGEPASAPLSDLPFRVHLSEAPPPERCWSAEAVEAFRQGRRPEPLVLFGQMVEVLDTFMDFRRSLADQPTMTELLATYVLATWFLDAFQVIGYLWPNGDRGSGKTQCLLLMAELCHLGLVVQGGASFATLRDMADYGATLAFDDAEAFASPGRTDPDKRTLLLAGNRRGSVVSLKEPVGKGRWQTPATSTPSVPACSRPSACPTRCWPAAPSSCPWRAPPTAAWRTPSRSTSPSGRTTVAGWWMTCGHWRSCPCQASPPVATKPAPPSKPV